MSVASMSELTGKWVQKEGQPYAGLWFEFGEDGRFEAQFEPMGIVSGGTYQVAGSEITMQQTEHTLGLVGEFKGLCEVEGSELKMALAAGPGQDRPADLSGARVYIKE
jgi:hypothetical protein